MTTPIASEALERRARSEAALRAQGVPINNHLPAIETEDEVDLRSPQDIAYRALCLLMVAVVAKAALEGNSYDLALMVEELGVEDHLSADEIAYMTSLFSPEPAEEANVQFVWRFEAAWTLLWALGHVESLGTPTDICDVEHAESFLFSGDPAGFVKNARLRPLGEILEQADRIYRYHWAVRNAQLRGLDEPAGLDGSVVMERHYALNWLVGDPQDDWDDVSTST